MKLSVVIPARNEFPQICFTIYSIVHDLETFLKPGDWEIIIVNNCSTDEEFPRRALGGTTDYLMARGMYWNGLLRVVYDPLAGNHSARNKGAEVAKGDYIFISDGHMAYNSGFFKRMLQTCEESGGIVHATINWMGAYPPTHVGYQYTIKLGEEIKGCVDEKTELLTLDGWKKYDDVSKNTLFATVNMDNHNLEFQKPLDVLIKQFQGEMVSVKGRSYDALLTNYHRSIYRDWKGKWKIRPAKDITKKTSLPIGHNGIIKNGGELSNDIVELLGWIIAEGCYSGNTIEITQYIEKNRVRIKELLDSLGLSYCIHGKKRDFKIHQNDTKKIKELLPKKELSVELLNKCNRQQLEILYRTLIDADGVTTKTNESFYQVNQTTADNFQILCALIGRASKLYKRTPEHFKGNHFGKKDINVVSVKKSKYVQKVSVGKENYSGIVWCPTLPNGTIIARRNGHVFITGNTWSNYAPTTKDWFYIPAQGHCSLMVNRKQFLDFGGYPKYHRTYGGGEFYLNMKWWMFGSNVVCEPRAFGYHLACGRGYDYNHEREYLHNVLYIGKILGMDDWVERAYINWLRHHNKEVMALTLKEAEEEALRGERQFVEKRRKKTFNELICERPWDKMNDAKHGTHCSGLSIFQDTIIPLFQENPHSKEAWDNNKYQEELGKFIDENLKEFVYGRKITPQDSL